jgi:hypothetical protein
LLDEFLNVRTSVSDGFTELDRGQMRAAPAAMVEHPRNRNRENFGHFPRG